MWLTPKHWLTLHQGCIKFPTTWYSSPSPFFVNSWFSSLKFPFQSPLQHLISFPKSLILKERWYCFAFSFFLHYILPHSHNIPPIRLFPSLLRNLIFFPNRLDYGGRNTSIHYAAQQRERRDIETKRKRYKERKTLIERKKTWKIKIFVLLVFSRSRRI